MNFIRATQNKSLTQTRTEFSPWLFRMTAFGEERGPVSKGEITGDCLTDSSSSVATERLLGWSRTLKENGDTVSFPNHF